MASQKSKKRKLQQHNSNGLDTSKPTALFKPTGGRSWTLSVAIPSSIVVNAQSHDLKTVLAGTIARALAVFCVDEVVIFDDAPHNKQHAPARNDAYTAYSDPGHFLAHLLSYLETPPHLRRYLFPMSENLRTAGTLPSLDMPHHLRPHEVSKYREGVTYDDEGEPGSKRKKVRGTADEADTWTNVDIGLEEPVSLPLAIPPNTRLTLRFTNEDTTSGAEAAAPTAPREESGLYWGYTVRRCSSISAVFTECEFDGGYDLSIGTSERGQPLSELVSTGAEQEATVPKFAHLVVVFGGLAGLEAAVRADPELKSKGIVDAKDLFDFWVDVCPGQGSRTIRTEEALWIGLMGLRVIVQGNDRR